MVQSLAIWQEDQSGIIDWPYLKANESINGYEIPLEIFLVQGNSVVGFPLSSRNGILKNMEVSTTPQIGVSVIGIKAEIDRVADIYGVSKWLLLELLICESGYNHNVCGDNGLSCGLYQYTLSTWQDFEEEFGVSLDRTNWKDQIVMTAIALKNNKHCRWTNCMNKIHKWEICPKVNKNG